jgi:cardiolipin synthase
MLKGALISGKICTTILFISLILMVMIPTLPNAAIYAIAVIDIVFMLISFIDYLITYSKRDTWFQTLEEQA